MVSEVKQLCELCQAYSCRLGLQPMSAAYFEVVLAFAWQVDSRITRSTRLNHTEGVHLYLDNLNGCRRGSTAALCKP